jgi:hypothetical protein
LVLIVQTTTTATDEVVGVTYGGAAMTEVPLSPLIRSAGDENGVLYGYFLGASIPTGAQTVAIDASAVSVAKRAVAITVTAADDTSVEDTSTSDVAATTAPTVTLTTSVETFIAGCKQSGVDAVTGTAPSAAYTNLLENDFGTVVGSWQRRTSNASAGSPVCDWTQNNEEAGVLAVAIREGTGGAAHTEEPADTADVTDTSGRQVTKAVADNISGSDTDAIAYVRAVADQITGADNQARVWTATRTIGDTAELSDGVATDTGGGTGWTEQVDDTATATDGVAKFAAGRVADTFSGTDAAGRAVAHTQADAVQGTDATAKTVGHVLADTATIADGITTGAPTPGVCTLSNAPVNSLALADRSVTAVVLEDEALTVLTLSLP